MTTMTGTVEDGNGRVIEATVDNGDGTWTTTRYTASGTVESTDTYPSPPPPPVTVGQAVEALLTLTAESTLTTHAEQVAPETARLYAPLLPAWTSGEDVTVDGTVWEAIQAHTTQDDWTPPKTPALWRVWRQADKVSEWVQPTGAHDAYAKGALVTHGGQTWRSLVDGNVWEPTKAVPTLWETVI